MIRLACPICEEPGPWANAQERMAHIRAHHTVDCELCGRPVNASGLGPHMAAHRRAAEPVPAEPAVPAPVPDQDIEPEPVAHAPEPAAATPAADPPAPTGKVCEVEGCDRPAAKSTTMCSGHRGRWYRTGDVQAHVPLRTRRSFPEPEPPAPPPAPEPPVDPPPPRIDRNARVACPDCDEMVRPHGLGSHRASHRRAAAQAAALPPAGRPLGEVLAELLPGAADELVDRLAAFVEKHEPDAGHGRWVVATAEGGPWLCRTAGISLLVAREHVPCIVVALDDIYAHTGRPAGTGLDAGRSWPPHRKAAAS